MGNKLVVDSEALSLDELLNLDLQTVQEMKVNISSEKNEFSDSQNLKIWKVSEDEFEKLEVKAINLTLIKEEKFLFHSEEAYIILIAYKGGEEMYELSTFPNSIWGIVESSSNMTPRGLKYMFSSSSSQSELVSESLESYMLSKRDFKNSQFKFMLFIWNGKSTSAIVKSTVLMKAFDLDRKLSNPTLLSYLYNGYIVKNSKLVKTNLVSLNEIINNTFENIITEENVKVTPTTETFLNYHETVYLLQMLYPITPKVSDKTIKTNNFPKFSNMFLKTNKNYYDCFVQADKPEKEEKVPSLKSPQNNSSDTKNLTFKLNLKNELSRAENVVPKIEVPCFKLGIKHKVLNEGIYFS